MQKTTGYSSPTATFSSSAKGSAPTVKPSRSIPSLQRIPWPPRHRRGVPPRHVDGRRGEALTERRRPVSFLVKRELP